MSPLLTAQTIMFLTSLAVGAALSIFYDIFRVLRIAFPTPSPLIFLQDLLYMVVCGLVAFLSVLEVSGGQIRILMFVGMLLGWIICHNSLGELIIGLSSRIIHAIRSIWRFFWRWLIHPILRLFAHIGRWLLGLGQKVLGFFGLRATNLKYRLKSTGNILYNKAIKAVKHPDKRAKPEKKAEDYFQ